MRILVVEDDRQLGEALAAGLRQLGHVVDWFTDGKQADSALTETGFDAIVLDLGLPGTDGMSWLARWRSQQIKSPIVILTARDQIDHRIRGLDAGADDYLVKPITIDELAARIRALVRRSAGHAQALWKHGALDYDPASKAVFWKGNRVELTGREIALLEAFLTQPQRVLSKAVLQDKLYDWGEGGPESNTLEVYIYHLRRKISPTIIRTVRGVGYVMGNGEPAP
ncbi:response regulator [Xylophilus sp. Kf1]|nr:response regulator [Xylophilus sp. Kf1]